VDDEDPADNWSFARMALGPNTTTMAAATSPKENFILDSRWLVLGESQMEFDCFPQVMIFTTKYFYETCRFGRHSSRVA
jgi:hypothetical protein